MSYKKSHDQPVALPCCYRVGDVFSLSEKSPRFGKNAFSPPDFTGVSRRFCDIFNKFRILMKTARNGKRFVALVALCSGFGYSIKIAYLPNKFNVEFARRLPAVCFKKNGIS